MPTMSLRHVSPRNLAMPLHSSSMSIDPLLSQSSVTKRRVVSSSEMSSSSKMRRTRSSALSVSKVSRSISISAADSNTSSMLIPFFDAVDLKLLMTPLASQYSRITFSNSDIFLAKKALSRRRCLRSCCSFALAACTTFSTNIATITLNKPNDMKTAMQEYSTPKYQPWSFVNRTKSGLPFTSAHSFITMQRNTEKKEMGTDPKYTLVIGSSWSRVSRSTRHIAYTGKNMSTQDHINVLMPPRVPRIINFNSEKISSLQTRSTRKTRKRRMIRNRGSNCRLPLSILLARTPSKNSSTAKTTRPSSK
mmetsp:Transcript_6754/g.18867  ORF Transcript_6754/g.18867 Transcript_6754/m.18867 type:complete len:306 (-) Transcript_6754:949-1866(-)